MKMIRPSLKRNARNKGFTIVELLVVIVVISILATVTVVAYTGISNNAHDSSVKAYLNQLARQVHLELVEDGSFGTGSEAYTRVLSALQSTSAPHGLDATESIPVIINAGSLYSSGEVDFNVYALSQSGKGFMMQVSSSGSSSIIPLTGVALTGMSAEDALAMKDSALQHAAWMRNMDCQNPSTWAPYGWYSSETQCIAETEWLFEPIDEEMCMEARATISMELARDCWIYLEEESALEYEGYLDGWDAGSKQWPSFMYTNPINPSYDCVNRNDLMTWGIDFIYRSDINQWRQGNAACGTS